MSERQIRSLTKLLKDRGHLKVETNHGPHQANVCRLILNRKSASSFIEEVRRVFLSPVDPNQEAGFLINEEKERTKRGSFQQEKRKPASDKLLKNHSSNQTSRPPCSLECLIPSRAREPAIADALGSLGAQLQARLGADRATSWFGKTAVLDVVGEVLTLQAPDKFVADRIRQDFDRELLACCAALLPQIEVVRIVAAGEVAA